MERRNSKQVRLGDVFIGGNAPISIQSMTNTDTADAIATITQILQLEANGCEIVRISVYNEASAAAIREIKETTHIPLVADIHFDHRLAIQSMENGIDKLRINPGNIGGESKVRELVACAKSTHTPIRIGVNAGSLQHELIAKYHGVTAEAMVESAMQHIALLEKEGFEDIVVSLKASDVIRTVEANRLLAKKVDYPIHIGVTEAGLGHMAVIKSSAGVGTLLLEGIGDTIRISITGDPVQEVIAGWDILRALGIRKRGIEIISCPTCGRTGLFDLAQIVREIEEQLPTTEQSMKIAVMGCVVNGPGEAAEADLGIAFASDRCVLFSKGKKIKTALREEAIPLLLKEVQLQLNNQE